MDRTLIIENGHNMSLESYNNEQIQLMLHSYYFYTVYLQNVSFFTIKQIMTTPPTQNLTGLFRRQYGIKLLDFEFIEVHSATVNNYFNFALWILNCNSILINKVIITSNNQDGILMKSSYNLTI